MRRVIPDITRVQLKSLLILADDDGSGEMSKQEFIEFLTGDDCELEEREDIEPIIAFSESNEYLADVYLHLGLNYMYTGNYSSALRSLVDAFDTFMNIASLYRSHNIPVPQEEISHELERTKADDGDDYMDGDVEDEQLQELARKAKVLAEYDPSSPDRNLHFLQCYPEYITTIALQAQCFHFSHQYHDAEELYKKLLRIREFVLGTHHLDYSAALNSYGLMQLERGQTDEAEELFKRALKLRDEGVGRDHPAYAEVLHNRALVYAARRNYAYAGKIFEEAIEINRKCFGKKSPEVARGLKNIEALMISQGNDDLAQDIRTYLKVNVMIFAYIMSYIGTNQ